MINYPTDEWIDNYIDKHADSTIKEAEMAWWDSEIDKGHETPFDLNDKQEKVVKEMRKGAKAVNAYGKTVKRERKPNETKRLVISWFKVLMEGMALNGKCANVVVSNTEKSIDFEMDGKQYTITLTEHRASKKVEKK